MQILPNVPMGQFTTIITIALAVAWITVGGTPALVASIIGGGLIAVKASGDEDDD